MSPLLSSIVNVVHLSCFQEEAAAAAMLSAIFLADSFLVAEEIKDLVEVFLVYGTRSSVGRCSKTVVALLD